MPRKKFPIVVKRGHAHVKIYHTPSKGSDSYTVAYYFGDSRKRKVFADLNKAEREADLIANKLANGEHDVVTLKNQDRLSYVHAKEALKDTGTALEMAAMQFAEASKILDGGSLLEAVKFYAKHHPAKMPRKTPAEVTGELEKAKQADGMSRDYLKDLRLRLKRFSDYFPCQLSEIAAPQIEDFLRSLELSGRSRNNYRRTIGTLLKFAQARRYLPKGETEIDNVSRAKQAVGDIGIFTPKEMATLLESADPELIPFLAIGAFAGLRHAEIQRLEWDEVHLLGDAESEGYIEVKAKKAKTASRRLVPVTENLRLWLLPYGLRTGNVSPYVNMTKQFLKHADSVGVTWKHNALRHSFVSYRVAMIQNVAQVALEAGNSPRMVFDNYRALVTPNDANRWFEIIPANIESIIQFQTRKQSIAK
jgi:integrase